MGHFQMGVCPDLHAKNKNKIVHNDKLYKSSYDHLVPCFWVNKTFHHQNVIEVKSNIRDFILLLTIWNAQINGIIIRLDICLKIPVFFPFPFGCVGPLPSKSQLFFFSFVPPSVVNSTEGWYSGNMGFCSARYALASSTFFFCDAFGPVESSFSNFRLQANEPLFFYEILKEHGFFFWGMPWLHQQFFSLSLSYCPGPRVLIPGVFPNCRVISPSFLFPAGPFPSK